MHWKTLARRLFPGGLRRRVRRRLLLTATGTVRRRADVTVIGTTDHAPIGVELALAQARVVLTRWRQHPGRPILLLIDTQGQQLRRRDELLGING